MCWGQNAYGQLGDGTDVFSRSPPAAVVGLTDAVQITAGYNHTCARRASGSVVCWGSTGAGLGDGTTLGRNLPVAVLALSDAVEVSAGGTHTCARQSSGTVVCWGRNIYGEIGDGSRTNRSTPTLVEGLTDATDIAAGYVHNCARRSSGAVVCWGHNGDGQIGDGSLDTLALTAVAVVGLVDAVEVGAGRGHSCAARSGGDIVCWGSGYYGQLGVGLSGSLVPVTVLGF